MFILSVFSELGTYSLPHFQPWLWATKWSCEFILILFVKHGPSNPNISCFDELLNFHDAGDAITHLEHCISNPGSK